MSGADSRPPPPCRKQSCCAMPRLRLRANARAPARTGALRARAANPQLQYLGAAARHDAVPRGHAHAGGDDAVVSARHGQGGAAVGGEEGGARSPPAPSAALAHWVLHKPAAPRPPKAVLTRRCRRICAGRAGRGQGDGGGGGVSDCRHERHVRAAAVRCQAGARPRGHAHARGPATDHRRRGARRGLTGSRWRAA